MCSAYASTLNYSSSNRGCLSAISIGQHLCIFGGATAYGYHYKCLLHSPQTCLHSTLCLGVEICNLLMFSSKCVSVWYSTQRSVNLPWAYLLWCVACRWTFLITWFFSHLSDKKIQTFKPFHLRWPKEGRSRKMRTEILKKIMFLANEQQTPFSLL